MFINKYTATRIYIEEVVIENLNKLNIAGIENIENLYFVKNFDNNQNICWTIETQGTNLNKILALDIINFENTYSDNIWEIYNIFGVEAARTFLISEFKNLMTDINVCHIKILAERMTFIGKISSISRYTMRADASSVLGKASFEETLDNFINACFFSETEQTNGVSASVMLGKRSNVGSGLCDLLINVAELPPIR